VQKVRLEEDVRCVSVCNAELAALEMLHPEAARILQLRRQAASYSLLFYLASQRPRLREIAHVLSETIRRRHKLETTRYQLSVCGTLVYPEAVVAASVFAEEKVAKGRVVQTKRLSKVFWNVKNSMQILQHTIYLILWYKEECT
jgi:hypothetical protein